MNLFDAMRALVQVVDSGGYTTAARLLNAHKSTVSQQIQQLEERLGTRLLIRTTRTVVPTTEGRAYYEHARDILRQVDETETILQEGRSSASGFLRVDVPQTLGRMVLDHEIHGFLDRYPKITLELGCTDRVVDLIKEGVDCALRGGGLPDSQLAARRVGNIRSTVCAAPDYIEKFGLPETPDDLARHTRIGRVSGSSGKTRPLQLWREGTPLDVAMPTRFVTTDSSVMLSAGLDGLGIVQLDEFVASHYIGSGALVRLLPGWRCASWPLHLVTPSRHRRTARVQVFLNWAHALLLRRLGPHLERSEG